MSRAIVVTDRDFWRLSALVRARAHAARDQAHIGKLAEELARSVQIKAAEAPADVVTMHTRVRVRDMGSGEVQTYTLAFPHEADLTSARLSVLAPLGTALLGYRQGDEIVWEMPGGARRLLIEQVQPATRQPPAAERLNRSTGPVRGHAAGASEHGLMRRRGSESVADPTIPPRRPPPPRFGGAA